MEPTPIFDISTSHKGTMDIVTVRGEIDLVTAPVLRDALDGLGSRITVDLRAVTFIDSTGLAVLIDKKLRADGGEFRIVADGPAVLRLFELTGLMDMLEPVPDPEPASPKERPDTTAS
jgi:anti-sigma B factor antagonist